MGKTIGIDLGTTNSCVAIIKDGEAIVVANNEGVRTTPSVVAFTETGERLVGQIAKRQAVTNAENTIFAVKRFIGRRFDSDEVRQDMQRISYHLMKSDRGDAWINVRDQTYSPSEISAFILIKMKEIAESYLGEPVTSAVISVPAYFNDSQRQATRDAGRIAGLEVERIVNEPTAAALAFGAEKQGNCRVAVYDLGGGTFDISILELSDGVFQVKATNGDTHLGGEDFDFVIMTFLCDAFKEQHKIDLRKDRLALQRVKDAAEKAKHELSSATKTDIHLPFIAADAEGPKHLNVQMTRSQLEELTKDLIERTIVPCEAALADAGMTVKDIDEVLLVGGMTRMPKVQERVAAFFGREPNKQVNPDEVVAIGAAMQGAVMTGEIKNVLLLDVTPLSLGVETAGGVMTPLIARNTTVPSKHSQVFSTALDNQPTVNIHVLQGERPMAADNQTLAFFELVGIAPAPRGTPRIEVTFDIDANGIVHVSAKDLGTGQSQTVKITAQSGLSEEEIRKIIATAEENRSADVARKRLAELRNSADGLIYSAQRTIDEFSAKLPPNEVERIKTEVATLQNLLEGSDVAAIESAYSTLEVSAYRLTDLVYANKG